MPDLPELRELFAHLTEPQRRAVLAVDRSLLVSAAAGAGKTMVLAERIAALVCDLPAPRRCRVDELLVVTFTEAAAREMRTRIGSAIQKRIAARPRDDYLREQLYLLDNASISTIHAFCRALIQRWFPQAEVDPQVAVLAEDEAELLRLEVIEDLFEDRFGSGDDAGARFRQFLEEYADGSEARVRPIVLQLSSFLGSLPAPEDWMRMAHGRLAAGAQGSLVGHVDECQKQRLLRELSLQAEYAQELAATVRSAWPVASLRAEALDAHAAQLQEWHAALGEAKASAWTFIADAISNYDLKTKRKPSKLSPEDSAAYDAAKDLVDEAKRLLKSRLRDALCRFTTEEYETGLQLIAPHVHTLLELVYEFNERYREAKRNQAVVDFEDLQRSAYRLLIDPDNRTGPSEVARHLQRQYRHVLVDEFQDVDPLQEAILRMVSRESADPPAGNLFTVGDIKQSIYRFRLAEPDLFAKRTEQFADGSDLGEVIHLQENFRSRREVLDAVNAVFRPLMRPTFGGTDYDAHAELRAGMAYPEAAEDGPVFGRPAVELHLLEPITSRNAPTVAHTDDEDDGSADANGGDEELDGLDREALLIGRRIRTWMGLEGDGRRWQVADRPATPGGALVTRPVEFSDIVILLRSMLHKAEPIAEVLRRMGIPVRIERAEESIDSTEYRDLLSLLQVLDNQQQDIPLAAVLRSPLLGQSFSESELLEIRLLDREVPFHAAVARYAREGKKKALRERIAAVLSQLDRYRTRMRRSPVADVLWEIYQETDYLAYVSGLPGGLRRQEHLISLHEVARQFGGFARQGLRRFLRFVEDLIAQERQPVPGMPGSANDNVVRIMSIHASKGLEFPIVVLPDLSKRFNLQDLRGNVIVDRKLGIGLRAVNADQRIRYPTLAHQLAAEQVLRETLSEELRILYVALTRAREHLVLVARLSPQRIERCRHCGRSGGGPAISQLQLETAGQPIDWLLPAVCTVPELANWPEDERTGKPSAALFEVRIYPRSVTDEWNLPSPIEPAVRTEALAALAQLRPLPPDEPLADALTVEPLIRALTHDYPAWELTSLPARIGVTELKRRWDALSEADERADERSAAAVKHGPRAKSEPVPRPQFLGPQPAGEALARGTATHRFLQQVDLRRACDAADLADQLAAMTASGAISAEDAAQVMIDGAAWFFTSPLGIRLRDHADAVQREVAFVWRMSPSQVDPSVQPRDERDVVLIRGMVDVVLADGDHLEILDYKTDRAEPADCARLAEGYRHQLRLYAAALADAYRCPVERQYLVFLHPRQIIEPGVKTPGCDNERVKRK
ncbi:MAG: helicase-exonuclease AddAB subunit AddA [Phycisphaerae bacterium]|nr:helicase-exonuclease AddAB subunit AddA [Phycisphaerae bacterium]